MSESNFDGARSRFQCLLRCGVNICINTRSVKINFVLFRRIFSNGLDLVNYVSDYTNSTVQHMIHSKLEIITFVFFFVFQIPICISY